MRHWSQSDIDQSEFGSLPAVVTLGKNLTSLLIILASLNCCGII